MDQLTKIQKKLLKEQHRDFKKKFQVVRKAIRRIKDLKRTDKKALIADLSKVNIDLLHVLLANGQFKNTLDYFDTINAYLRSEMDSYEYPKRLRYKPGQMFEVMEQIRVFHNNMDRYNDLRSKIIS